ncbi:hypothetical protein HI914_02825 [Erysiphe necator]|nr:hypothetical protein HI914_02825 [Erysiphe necator]
MPASLEFSNLWQFSLTTIKNFAYLTVPQLPLPEEDDLVVFFSSIIDGNDVDNGCVDSSKITSQVRDFFSDAIFEVLRIYFVG